MELPEDYKHSAPTGLAQAFRTAGGRAASRVGSSALPFTIYHLRFTTLMIGFDRSAFVAGPLCGLGNQNVNRVCVRFMTKVFRSVLPKIRSLTDFL